MSARHSRERKLPIGATEGQWRRCAEALVPLGKQDQQAGLRVLDCEESSTKDPTWWFNTPRLWTKGEPVRWTRSRCSMRQVLSPQGESVRTSPGRVYPKLRKRRYGAFPLGRERARRACGQASTAATAEQGTRQRPRHPFESVEACVEDKAVCTVSLLIPM